MIWNRNEILLEPADRQPSAASTRNVRWCIPSLCALPHPLRSRRSRGVSTKFAAEPLASSLGDGTSFAKKSSNCPRPNMFYLSSTPKQPRCLLPACLRRLRCLCEGERDTEYWEGESARENGDAFGLFSKIVNIICPQSLRIQPKPP